MKLLIVRHAEPDYAIDGLTEKGKREALLLSDRLVKENISAVYCSTLGRAILTAEPTLERLGIKATLCPWLREFDYTGVTDPKTGKPDGCWDLLPSYANENPDIYTRRCWSSTEFIRASKTDEEYENVCRELDAMLKNHGYERDGYVYRAIAANHDTVVLFCHFGVSAVLLSHLLNCSPYSIWQHVCTLPSSVTVLYTEEREEEVAHFRAASIGDLSHLYAAGEEPSFAARFCECFTDETRH